MDEDMKEYGLTILKGVGESKVIWMFSIIGEIEGHESAQQQTKTTQYEHVLPLLTKAENQEEVEGILFLIFSFTFIGICFLRYHFSTY